MTNAEIRAEYKALMEKRGQLTKQLIDGTDLNYKIWWNLTAPIDERIVELEDQCPHNEGTDEFYDWGGGATWCVICQRHAQLNYSGQIIGWCESHYKRKS